MRSIAMRIVLSLPVMIVLGFTDEVRAQPRYYGGYGVGLGVGVGTGYGPYWGPGWGWGAGWAYQPNYNYWNGSWGNGLSLYGPPVPTGKPVPGMFGGGDSQFHPLPPLYPGWVYIPIHKPATLPPGIIDPTFPGAELQVPADILPPPAPRLDKPAPLEVEVRLPRDDAKLFIDGEAMKSTGLVRSFTTPPQERIETFTYDLRAEWLVDGLKTTHTKRVVGRVGEKVVVEFK